MRAFMKSKEKQGYVKETFDLQEGIDIDSLLVIIIETFDLSRPLALAVVEHFRSQKKDIVIFSDMVSFLKLKILGGRRMTTMGFINKYLEDQQKGNGALLPTQG